MNADAAMYHAKGMGKNGYSFFDASMNTNARKQLQLLQDLRNALEHGEFRLYYQPKFDAVSGIAVGAEALLRWEHPQQGLLLPAAFIALAEKTGLIIAIGEWVLDEACRQMSLWYAQGYQRWRIAVNLRRCSSVMPGWSTVLRLLWSATTTRQQPHAGDHRDHCHERCRCEHDGIAAALGHGRGSVHR